MKYLIFFILALLFSCSQSSNNNKEISSKSFIINDNKVIPVYKAPAPIQSSDRQENIKAVTSDNILFDNYYGTYNPKMKNSGFPSKSLEGPKKENFVHPESTNRKYEIHVLFPHMKDPYWIAVNYGIISEAKRLGAKVHIFEAGGYSNLENQKKQFLNSINRKPDGIILAAINYVELDSLVQQAKNNGIKVVAVINDIHASAVDAKSMVSFFDMGFSAGEFIIKESGHKKNVKVAFLPGPIGSGWAPDTLKGFFRVMKKHPNKVRLLPPKWGDTGFKEQRQLLVELFDRYQNIDYIVCNAVAAEVAVEFLKENKLDQRVKIISTYIIPGVYEKIKKGEILAAPADLTVVQGKIAVDMMIHLLNGKKAGVDFPFRSGPIIPIISKDNIDSVEYKNLFAPKDYKALFSLK